MPQTQFPTSATIVWQISHEAAEQIYLKTGESPTTDRSITFSLDTPAERAAGLVLAPIAGFNVLQFPRVNPESISYKIVRKYDVNAGCEVAHDLQVPLYPRYAAAPVDDTPLSERDARTLLLALAHRVESQREQGRAVFLAEEAADKAARDARLEAEQAKVEAEQAARERKIAERAEWIAAHGSAFLRKAVAAGYDCQRVYVTERARVDLPGFEIDFDARSEWRSRSCPSEQALDRTLALREQGHNATVVWLTTPVSDDEAYDFEPCEAIVVEDYLDRYTAVR